MATDFVVKSGETFTLDVGFRIETHYNRFVLQSGSTLVLERDSAHFDVGELLIEDAVTILGPGKPGRHGKDGVSDKVQTGIGNGGWPGNHGEHGWNGTPGKNLTIKAMTMHPIRRHFLVDLRGGDGGNGGRGGDGGMGGNAGCPQKAGDGGPGGNGGNGGNGGSGGKFLIQSASYVGGGSPPEPTEDVFRMKGGGAGRGGLPGAGGHGGDATTCGPWGTVQVGGGGPGGPGNPGKRGSGGETHIPRVIAI